MMGNLVQVGDSMVSMSPRSMHTSDTIVAATLEDVDAASRELAFIIHGETTTARHRWFRDGLVREMLRRGHVDRTGTLDEFNLVINLTDFSDPKPFRRKAQGTFVATIVDVGPEPDDIFRAFYPVLLYALSNLGVFVVTTPLGIQTHFMTMEQGHYVVECIDGQDENAFFAEIYERMAPLATSQLVINNRYIPDLPASLWEGDVTTRQLSWAGEKLGEMNLLPAPWPIQDMLSERDLKHVMRLFGIGGLSYGNLSARRDETTFWMSASGVDKSRLREIGRDILLVTDYDRAVNEMVISVPPHVQPRRVSVDAIEHHMIYREHPEVGAIIHIHAWMDGIESTHVNYPCGTRELAVAVSDLVRRSPDPSRAVVGLKNHGLTITGHSLPEIFERIDGRIIPQVPMS